MLKYRVINHKRAVKPPGLHGVSAGNVYDCMTFVTGKYTARHVGLNKHVYMYDICIIIINSMQGGCIDLLYTVYTN